jgi:tRNA (mo5U34)-methyltransferase
MTSLLQQFASAPSKAREDEILALGPWFHNLHLPDGARTAPGHALGDFPAFKWHELAPHLPADLTGWTALDIGCNAGFYAFELAKRGAQVTGIDVEPLFLRQAEWAAREYGLADRVRFRQAQVYDLAQSSEQYDLVLFMGVFYHLRYPMLGLDIVAQTVRRLMVFQTLTMPGIEVHPDTARFRSVDERADFLEPGWPRMAFLEHPFAGDETNWWAPNHAGVEAMMRAAGLQVTGRPAHEMYLCEPDPEARPWTRGRGRAELLAATGRPWRTEAPEAPVRSDGGRNGA